MDVVTADRLQFAFTIMFHYLFPITTIGLAPFVAIYTIEAAARRRDAARAATFWTRIFAVNFAVGVVTGIPMEFQFGTNWAAFSAAAGAVIGQPLAMEGTYAFFLESIFLGVLLWGKDRVAPWLYSTLGRRGVGGLVALGLFHRRDGRMDAAPGRLHDRVERQDRDSTSLPALLLSPFAWWQYVHVLCGAMVAGSFVVAGVGAYYLLSNRENGLGAPFRRCRRDRGAGLRACWRSFRPAIVEGDEVTAYQPSNSPRWKGCSSRHRDAPLAIIGMPDSSTQTLIDPIFVPDMLSFLAYGNFRCEREGTERLRDRAAGRRST